MSLIARSEQAAAVARHIVKYSPQVGFPTGVGPVAYRRALLRLENAGVLRRWRWYVEGALFTPTNPVARYLWLAGPRWGDYVEEAACKGLLRPTT